MTKQAKWIFLFCGLGILLWGVSLAGKVEGLWIMTIGGFIIVLVCILQTMESMDAKGRAKRKNYNSKPICFSKEFQEAHEMKFEQRAKEQEFLSDEDLMRDAKDNLGWGQEKGKDLLKKNWWIGRYIECKRCRKTFQLQEADTVKLPLQLDPSLSSYVEINCPTCNRYITIFES